MAKKTKRFTVKGEPDFENGVFIEYHKDLGEVTHSLEDIFSDFKGLDNVNFTLTYDQEILD